MKVTKEILDAVEKILQYDAFKQTYIKNETICRVLDTTCDIQLSQREMRAAIQELRCSGRVRCLIASGKGYKFTNVTSEMENYLKRLHKSAMQILRLYSAEKSQAETDLGMMLTLPFYSELYKEKKA